MSRQITISEDRYVAVKSPFSTRVFGVMSVLANYINRYPKVLTPGYNETIAIHYYWLQYDEN